MVQNSYGGSHTIHLYSTVTLTSKGLLLRLGIFNDVWATWHILCGIIQVQSVQFQMAECPLSTVQNPNMPQLESSMGYGVPSGRFVK